MPLDDKTRKQFEKWNQPPPKVFHHGTEDEIKKNMTELKPDTWVLEGNKLTTQTDVGPLVQYIPVSHILVGVDKNNRPKFKKID